MLEGITGSPYKTPSVRRKIPKNYARPSITVGGASTAAFVRREWTDIPVIDVAVHDTVAEFGIVAETEEITRRDGLLSRPYVWLVRLHNVLGEVKEYPGHTRVFAFTAVAKK